MCVSDWSQWKHHDPVSSVQRRPSDGQPAHDRGRALIVPHVHLLGGHQHCRWQTLIDTVNMTFLIIWISLSVLFISCKNCFCDDLWRFVFSAGCEGLSSFYSELMKGFGAGTRLWELLDRKPEFPLNGQYAHAYSLTRTHTGRIILLQKTLYGGSEVLNQIWKPQHNNGSELNDHSIVVSVFLCSSTEGLVLPTDQLKGQLEFDDVTFAYPTRSEAPIFQNLSLMVPAGTIMAVVGPSGSGKSTLVSLLLRLYDPDAGESELLRD